MFDGELFSLFFFLSLFFIFLLFLFSFLFLFPFFLSFFGFYSSLRFVYSEGERLWSAGAHQIRHPCLAVFKFVYIT